MISPSLKDKFGRAIKDLRISVTDRCNFRCFYCIPSENIVWQRKQDLLTYDEIVLLSEIAVSLGVEKVRLTGGEPLLRPDLEVLISRMAKIPALRDLAMTTNGAGLKQRASALRAAGLNRITISCDSLKPETFKSITKRDALKSVLDGRDRHYCTRHHAILRSLFEVAADGRWQSANVPVLHGGSQRPRVALARLESSVTSDSPATKIRAYTSTCSRSPKRMASALTQCRCL